MQYVHVRCMQSSTGRCKHYWRTIQSLQYITSMFHMTSGTPSPRSHPASQLQCHKGSDLGMNQPASWRWHQHNGALSLSLSFFLALLLLFYFLVQRLTILWRKMNHMSIDEPRLHPQGIAFATGHTFNQLFLGARRTKGKEFKTGMHHLRLHVGIHSLTQRFLQTDLPLVTGACKNRGPLRIHEVTRIQISWPGNAERTAL